MKIALLYLRILKKFDPAFPEHKCYEESSKRFLDTYLRFKPAIPHELIIVNCGSSLHDGMFDEVATQYRVFNGGGFDCGTYQAVGGSLDCDLVFGLNTHTYFWRHGWLERFADEFGKHGPGVYGATASFEINPHLRTPAIAFDPKIMREYPHVINNRQEAADFEAGPENFSLWAFQQRHTVRLVAADGSYPLQAWRVPQNIFRRGDQSNCLIFDRHTDIYAEADAETKLRLESDAN